MEDTIQVPTNKQKKSKAKYSRIKRKILSHVLAVRIFLIGILLISSVLFGFLAVKILRTFDFAFYYTITSNFLFSPVSQLAKEDDRTNILVMGKAGGRHDGPELTDTIMLISVSLNNKNIKIISIPRDLWIPEMRAKINSAYYWGNQKNVGGINFAKAEVSQVMGIPIHYGAVIDFSGFKDLIDQVGGIEVNVANGFTDHLYPIEGRENDMCGNRDSKYMCRYESLTFNPGLQFMDGETALKYVRSRHAEGEEGTDLAREARQAKVIEALKNKLSDKNTYLDLNRDKALLKVILRSIETDIDYPTAAIIGRKMYDGKDAIDSYLIPEELLINTKPSPTYDMQSVFIPKAGNGKWTEIQTWIAGIIKN